SLRAKRSARFPSRWPAWPKTACGSQAGSTPAIWWWSRVRSSCATACGCGFPTSASRHARTMQPSGAVMRKETYSLYPDTPRVGVSAGFNLSRWAIGHGGFTAFLLVLLLGAGVISFLRIGQKEDPDFTFRVMVVQVQWPGATVEEMQDQVVDKIERKLQETPG